MGRLTAAAAKKRWAQATAAQTLGLRGDNLAASFFDIDGEPLIARLQQLASLARQVDQPITFQ